MSEQRAWTGTTDGTSWMHRALIGLIKVTPLPLVYGFMALVIPFYLVFNLKGSRPIYRYLRDRQGWGRLRSLLGCYGNHFLFGATMLDRFAVYAGRRFQTEIPRFDLIARQNSRPEGFLFFFSHIGNPEMCGYMIRCDSKRMNSIVFPGEKASIQKWRSKMLALNNIRLIPSGPDMDWLFTLHAALSDGEIVSIHADRKFGSPKTLSVPLLGAPARIPAGPFAIAAMHGLPVLAGFSLKTGLKRYHLVVERLDTPEMEQMDREQRMHLLAERYAAVMEQVLRKWPLQWFNFFDFWAD